MEFGEFRQEFELVGETDWDKSYQFDTMTLGRCKMPNAVFSTGIIVRIIGRRYRTNGGRYLVFAATLFAIVTILVQGETVVTGTLVRAKRVSTLVLAIPVVVCTFVHVREKNSSETWFLDAVKLRLNLFNRTSCQVPFDLITGPQVRGEFEELGFSKIISFHNGFLDIVQTNSKIDNILCFFEKLFFLDVTKKI